MSRERRLKLRDAVLQLTYINVIGKTQHVIF
jgi:hypothetical protein